MKTIVQEERQQALLEEAEAVLQKALALNAADPGLALSLKLLEAR